MRFALSLLVALLPAVATAAEEKPAASLFENVARVLTEHYYDEAFRESELPKLVTTYRERAARAATFEAECDAVQAFLSNVPATHLALIAEDSFDAMHRELFGTSAPSFGFELIEYDGKHYAFNVLEQGPAEGAGLKRGDRIVTIDGVLPSESPRLGGRTDDAFLPDPPLRPVLGAAGDVAKLRIERRPGSYQDIEIPIKDYSAWEAAKASVRVIEQDGKRIGRIHFWMIHMTGPDELLRESLEGVLASCDALVLDLRGRGGNGMMVSRMLDVLDGTTSTWNKPVVGLINRHARSAKEVIAFEFRKRALGSLVGERTAGAVIPASIRDVGFGMKLMFPSFTLPEHTDELEFKGVAPDIVVSEVGPYSAGADPILEAGVKEAVRLAGEAPEKYAARRAAADKKYPRREAVGSARGMASRDIRKPKRPNKPDAPGFDPKAMKTLARMVDALGGEKALRAHKYRTTRGKRVMGGMMTATFEELQAAPNRQISRMKLPQMGEMEQGYNGTVGWTASSHEGTQRMAGEELDEFKSESDFYFDLNLEQHHRSIAYAGETEYAGRNCHEIRLTKPSGEVSTWYLDTSTFLQVGWIGKVETNMGAMEMTRVVDEFKTFDGEVVPVAYTDDVGGVQEMVTTVEEVSFDVIPAATFDPPKELAGTASSQN